MTPEDIVGVVGLLAVAFGRETSADTFEVYEAALEDLDVDNPRGLVLDLLRRMEWWPPPAVLRREILAAAGKLPPDEDEAWQMAMAYSRNPDRVDLPDAVREAVTTVGGIWTLRTGTQGVVFAQFRDSFRAARGRELRASLARSWKGVPLSPGSQVGLSHGRGHDDRGLPRGEAPDDARGATG